jgi:hypothetical protein
VSNPGRAPIFNNDDEIVILDASEGVTDTTRRPVSGARRKALEQELEKRAALRRKMQQMGRMEAEARRAQQKETSTSDVEQRFDAAMMGIYRRIKSEARYNAPRYFQLLADHPGLETARILLHAHSVSYDYITLWECGRLDLTVEALIHEHPEFHPLFTDEEREIAWKRLVEYEYSPVIGMLRQEPGSEPPGQAADENLPR